MRVNKWRDLCGRLLKTFSPLLSPYEENPFEYNQNEIYQEVNVTDLWALQRARITWESHDAIAESREKDFL